MQEIRGVWIANRPHSRVLESPTNIAQALDFLQQMRFNTVFPVVWNQGFTLFRSQVMGQYDFPQIAPFFASQNFDPLAELIEQGHSRNIAIIPWFEYGFAASPIADGGHILQTKPDWAALNKSGNNVRHGGLTWMNSLSSQVQQFMLNLILEVAQNYDIDGIQGDDRLPALPVEGGYDQETQERYRATFGTDPPQAEKNAQWVQWRADILTEFLANLYHQVKAVNPNLVVSMAPAVYPFCLDNLLQDSRTWIKRRLLDFIHPQIYRESFGKYQAEVNKINTTFTRDERVKFAPGIAFRANNIDVTLQDILKCVALNRQSGFQGQVFFYFEGLRKNNDAIAIALKNSGGYDKIASLPTPFSVV